MRKQVIIIVAAFVIVCMLGAGLVTKFIMTSLKDFRLSNSAATYSDVKVEIPSEVNEQTLAVFNFRPHGDSNTKYYAIGFARALADRIYCAPTGLTQQMTINEISCTLTRQKLDYRKPINDDAALKSAKKMGVCWMITGDLYQSGKNAKLTLILTDTRSGKRVEYKAAGAISDLPTMQTKLVRDVISGMGLKPTQAQLSEVTHPNFANSQKLELYGRSYLTDDVKQCEAYRWEAFDSDPQGSFPVLRLLEFYYSGPSTIPELQSNKRLASLLTYAGSQFRDNSHISVMKGLLLAKQCRYADAEAELRELLREDPDFVRGHTALAYVACCRENGELAVDERTKLVKMWPNNPFFHAELAHAYSIAASNARQGHYHSNMTPAMSSTWEANYNQALTEAVIAVKMDRDCEEGWDQLMNIGLQLSRHGDINTAFNELVRINPKNQAAYTSYAACFVPQWNGTEYDRQQIYARAEAAFGKNAPEVNYIRAATMMCYPSEIRERDTILSDLQECQRKCKTPGPDVLFLKSKVLFGLKRYDESENLAVEGTKRWNTLAWRFHLARCYSMRYEHKADMQALAEAEKLFGEYTYEIPYDPEGYIQWGWCLSHQGHRAEAKAKFLKALELDPTNESAKQKLQYVQ